MFGRFLERRLEKTIRSRLEKGAELTFAQLCTACLRGHWWASKAWVERTLYWMVREGALVERKTYFATGTHVRLYRRGEGW